VDATVGFKRGVHVHRTLHQPSIRLARVFAAVALAVGVTATSWVPTSAATRSCTVKNLTTGKSYSRGTGSIVQMAVDGARSGDVLEVLGRCRTNATVDKNLTILGRSRDGLPTPVLDGGGASRVLVIPSGVSLTLQDVEVANGSISGGDGGSIDNAGTLTLRGRTLVSSGNASGGGHGGAVHNSGTLIVTDTASLSGSATFGGGVANEAAGTVTITGSATVSGNGPSGAGVYNAGTLRVEGLATLAGYSQGGQGAALFNTVGAQATIRGYAFVDGGATYGGSIWNEGSVQVLDNARITGNASEYGGGAWNQGTMTLSDSATVTSSHASSGGGGVANFGDLTLTGHASISGNTVLSNGAGIFSNGGTITLGGHAAVSGNTSEGTGAGIYISGAALIVQDDATITGNLAQYTTEGGGIWAYCATLTGAVDGGNVDANLADDGTYSGTYVEVNITNYVCR
jgi:hypothetical protein